MGDRILPDYLKNLRLKVMTLWTVIPLWDCPGRRVDQFIQRLVSLLKDESQGTPNLLEVIPHVVFVFMSG